MSAGKGRGIDRAICAIKATLAKHGGVTKDRKAPMGYSFRGIEDFDNILCGITAEHGVNAYPRILSKDIRHTQTAKGAYQSHVVIEVEWTYVSTEDGSSQVASTIGEAMDTQDKAFNKAMQAARKYADIMVFRIPTSGDDTEAYNEQPAPSPATGARAAPPPAAKGSPPAPARTPTAGNSPPSDEVTEMFKRIGETGTLAVLSTLAEEVAGWVEPGRSELLTAVVGRGCLLFGEAKDLDAVKSGYALVEAMQDRELKSACNKAYSRVKPKVANGQGAPS